MNDIKKLFEKYDKNSDMTININEFEEMMKELGYTNFPTKKLFDKIQKNGSIDFKSFKNCFEVKEKNEGNNLSSILLYKIFLPIFLAKDSLKSVFFQCILFIYNFSG
jgi:Ca2+-binding EF-hand superfamily protein